MIQQSILLSAHYVHLHKKQRDMANLLHMFSVLLFSTGHTKKKEKKNCCSERVNTYSYQSHMSLLPILPWQTMVLLLSTFMLMQTLGALGRSSRDC